MQPDPIVEEVRKARDAYAQRFNYDLDAICRDLQKKQALSDKKVVSFPPKRPKKMIVSPSSWVGLRHETTRL
jgi:hypothetical protein